MAKNFKDRAEQEILALAISSEETDGRIYADFAARLKADYPATAQIFKEMEAEEENHRRQLIDEYRPRFGGHIPLIRRQEAVSDDGSLTGRGKPLLRGIVCGLMTTAGGIGHTLPYLIPNFRTA